MVIDAKDMFECEACGKIHKLDEVATTCSGAELCLDCAAGFICYADENVAKKLQKSKGTVRCSVCGEATPENLTFTRWNGNSIEPLCSLCAFDKMVDGLIGDGLLKDKDAAAERREKLSDIMKAELERIGYYRRAELREISKKYDPQALGGQTPEEHKDITDYKKEEVYPNMIKRYLDRYVVGQEEAKKVLAVAAYNHYKRLSLHNDNIQKSNVMLVGPTGCGKTHLVKTLAKALNVPVALCQATCLTESGYVGDDPSSVVQRLYKLSDQDVERTQKGIIFIDEVDKLGGNAKNREVGGKGVQQALLPIIEGAKISITTGRDGKTVFVDTSNILFILGGAFPEIEDIVRKRLSDRGETVPDNNIMHHLRNEDFTAFGLIPEFMGRIPIHAVLHEMDVPTLKKILVEPEDSIVKQYQALFGFDNVELSFTDEALNLIAEKALAEHTGARALRTIIENVLLDVQFIVPARGIRKCVITKGFIEGTEEPDFR